MKWLPNMIGEKGIIFSPQYVKAFNRMEKELMQPKTELEVLAATVIIWYNKKNE